MQVEDDVATPVGVVVASVGLLVVITVGVGEATTVGGTSMVGTGVGVGVALVPHAERKKIYDNTAINCFFISFSCFILRYFVYIGHPTLLCSFEAQPSKEHSVSLLKHHHLAFSLLHRVARDLFPEGLARQDGQLGERPP